MQWNIDREIGCELNKIKNFKILGAGEAIYKAWWGYRHCVVQCIFCDSIYA